MIHLHEPVPEINAPDRTEEHAHNHDGEGEFEIMCADLAVAKSARLEHRDLFTLEGDLSAHHRIRHEGGHAEKDQGEGERQALQHPDFIVDAAVRGMVDATVGPARSVGCEHPIHGGNHFAFGGSGGEGDGDIIKGAIELEGGREIFVRHPEYTVGLIVGERRARRSLKDEFGRKHDAGKAEVLFGAVENRGDRAAGFESMGFCERFTDGEFTARGAAEREAAGAHVGPIKYGLAALG